MIVQRLVLALLTPLVVYAQEADTSQRLAESYRRLFFPELKLLAQSYGDSVVLRWAPSNAPAWRAYNRIGYHVERALLDTTSPTPLRYERLTQEPLKPWTLEEWKRRSRPEQQFAAIAAQCLYGRVSIPQPNTAESFLDAATELENRFGFALFAADCDAHAATGLGLRFIDRAVRIGVNPIGWSNDDLRELGGETPLEVCLREARQAGFEGIKHFRSALHHQRAVIVFPQPDAELQPPLRVRDAGRQAVFAVLQQPHVLGELAVEKSHGIRAAKREQAGTACINEEPAHWFLVSASFTSLSACSRISAIISLCGSCPSSMTISVRRPASRSRILR